MGFSFLVVRVYVGFWLSIIALTMAAFEGSVYVRLFTRFTQEIFSALITLIYIVETALKLVYTFNRHPLYAEYNYKIMENATTTVAPVPIDDDNLNEVNSTLEAVSTTVAAITSNITENSNLLPPWDKFGQPINQPNTALFCLLLTLGTFTSAYSLRIFRNSKFLGRNARRMMGDFGVPISIAIFVTIAYCLSQVFTEKLNVPDGISPSDPEKRGWLIPLADDSIPKWMPIGALVPALLVYILIFMETQISELIVGKAERGGRDFNLFELFFKSISCYRIKERKWPPLGHRFAVFPQHRLWLFWTSMVRS